MYNPSTNTFTSGPVPTNTSSSVRCCCQLPDGHVVFVPANSTTIGLCDPSPSGARSKPAYTLSQTLLPLWNVVLLPYYNKY
jgi:hypothetical protein